MTNQADCKQRIQEEAYAYPYHYIPTIEDGVFSQVQYWSWGYRYLGAIDLLLGVLEEDSFESLLDVGCGDGRFLREVRKRFPRKSLLGVDCSDRAIRLARAMNPGISYESLDICSGWADERFFDVVTLMEVLEHIPAVSVPDFLIAITKRLRSGGRLLLTVPHKNKPVLNKHYQHFDTASLKNILESNYRIERFIYFDRISRVWRRFISPLFGNRLMVLNNRFLLKRLFRMYQRRFFYCSEKTCSRVCVIARRR